MSSHTSLRCIFTSFYYTIEIFENQGLTDKYCFLRNTACKNLLCQEEKSFSYFFWPITGSRWHLNVVVWFRLLSLVAISISRGLCGLFFRIIVRSNIVHSALQCTLFFVTPVKRPLLNYHFFPDIRLDWESYNILPQDNQLLDMLVFVGQPLPVIQDGQEVVPALQEQDCYLCEEKPFIQVKLREHEGIRANRPFEVTPSQQVWYTVSC